MDYEPLNRAPYKDDIVRVVKNTRGRFPPVMTKAEKGEIGVVIGGWTSNYGSQKITILTEDLREIATTATCVHVLAALSDIKSNQDPLIKWNNIKLAWMDKTYVPLIVNKVKGYKAGWATSKNKSSILVETLNTQSRVWLSKDKVHPDDWITLLTGKTQCCAVRVPVWLARKSGAFG